MAKTYKAGVLITGDSKGAVKSINLTEKEIAKLSSTTEKSKRTHADASKSITDGFGSMAKSAALFAAAGIAAAGAVFSKMITATAEQDRVTSQLNATLKSTQFAAGKTADELTKTAAALQGITTYGDEAVISGQSLLLTFKNIKGDNFDRTTKSMLDMATAMGTDLKSAAIQLGKALNDPATQLSALSRSGITFSDSQKEMSKSMAESGRMAEAQSIILNELESQFGGSAEAARNTLGGALDALGNSWGDLFEVQSSASAGITSSINDINATISSPEFKDGMAALLQALIDITNNSISALASFSSFMRYVGESTAAITGSGAAGSMVELAESIEFAGNKLAFLEAIGAKNSDGAKALRAEIEKLNTIYQLQEELASNAAKGQAKLPPVLDKTTKSTTSLVVVSEKLVKAKKSLQTQIDKNSKSFQKAHSELDAMVKKTEEYIKSLEFETAQTTRSAREQEIENDVRSAGTRITAEQAVRIRDASAAKYDAKEASRQLAQAEEDAAQASQQAWESARNTLSGFFFEMAADGKNAFDTLVDGFKAMIAKMLAEAAANTILLAVGVGVSGSASAGAASGVSGGISSLFSGGSGASSLFGGGGGVTGAVQGGFNSLAGGYEGVAQFASQQGWHGVAGAAQTSAGQYTGSLGSSAANLGLNVGAGFAGAWAGGKVLGESKEANIGATIGGAVGSIYGPIGTAIGSFLGSGIGSIFEKGVGNNAAAADFDLSTGEISSRTWGNNGSDPGNVSGSMEIAETLKAFSDAIGGSNLSSSVQLGSKKGIEYGGKRYGQDVEAFLEDAYKDIIESATSLKDELKPLVLGLKGTAEEIAVFANAVASIDSQAGINTVTNAIEQFTLVQPSAAKAYAMHTDALMDQIDAFENTALSAANLANTLYENKTAAYEFALAIQSVGAALSNTAAQQAAEIRDSVLTPQELLDKRIEQGAYLRTGLDNQTDPERAAAIAARYIEINRQVFDSITDEQQLQYASEFAANAEGANASAQSILQRSLDGLETTQESLNSKLNAMLQEASAAQQRAADTQVQAAETQLTAAEVQKQAMQLAANFALSFGLTGKSEIGR